MYALIATYTKNKSKPIDFSVCGFLDMNAGINSASSLDGANIRNNDIISIPVAIMSRSTPSI